MQIWVECCFGMLVQRWAILRAALPIGISIKRTVALVNALAKLHNFCIDNNERSYQSNPVDILYLQMNENGFVPLEQREQSTIDLPLQLMEGGHHFNNYPCDNCLQQGREDEIIRRRDNLPFPRQFLLEQVEASQLVRPDSGSSNRR